jgi:hypothetical protein
MGKGRIPMRVIQGMFCCLFVFFASPLRAQNVIVVTTDGLRWEDVFRGADETLLNSEFGGVVTPDLIKKEFWRDNPEERRKLLLPFIWKEFATNGQLYGNRDKGSYVNVTNGVNVSNPGYSEMLTGVVDPRINSNGQPPNPNMNVFEWLNKSKDFAGKVAGLCAWNELSNILNRERSKFYLRVNDEKMNEGQNLSQQQKLLEEMRADLTPLWDHEIADALVMHSAIEYLKQKKPRVLYVSLGETDEWAHSGRYDNVLRSARNFDSAVAKLWATAQSMDEYRGKTSMLIAVDHGRGGGLKEWKTHGPKIAGAENIWVGILGPKVAAKGEVCGGEKIAQSQIAATIAALVGENYLEGVPLAASAIKY